MRLPPPWLRVRRLPATPAPPPPQPELRLQPFKAKLPPPWARARGMSLRFPATPAADVPEPSENLSHAGINKQFINRDPLVEPRTRLHTERVAVILNSLMRTGQLYVRPDGEWNLAILASQIEPGGGGQSGLTGTFSSGDHGV